MARRTGAVYETVPGAAQQGLGNFWEHWEEYPLRRVWESLLPCQVCSRNGLFIMGQMAQMAFSARPLQHTFPLMPTQAAF